MSTFIELLPPVIEEDAQPSPTAAGPVAAPEIPRITPAKGLPWSAETFADAQVRSLVQQLFLPGWLGSLRQVMFLPVDLDTDVTELCMRVGQALADSGSGVICVVRTQSDGQARNSERDLASVSRDKHYGALRDSSQQISRRLFLMPHEVFWSGCGGCFSAAWLRARLAELRLEFDYTVIQAPAAAVDSEAALVGRLCDGAVLVLQANSTRRITAQRAKERLQAASVRLLGTVLSERTFPVPEAIYRRL